jgi:hypothetical protein
MGDTSETSPVLFLTNFVDLSCVDFRTENLMKWCLFFIFDSIQSLSNNPNLIKPLKIKIYLAVYMLTLWKKFCIAWYLAQDS